MMKIEFNQNQKETVAAMNNKEKNKRIKVKHCNCFNKCSIYLCCQKQKIVQTNHRLRK